MTISWKFIVVAIMRISSLLICGVLASTIALESNENPVVYFPAGSFCGSILKSQSGRGIYAFRGIRYGKPPTGRNRFKQTTLAECLHGIVDATKDGPICPQPGAGSRKMSEDCLRLNVYTTALPDESCQPNRPVIVFFHSGGFIRSSGSTQDFGPQFILDQDIVFVSLNYRLGTLGFLSTGDHHAPGNAGLKDQVLAFRWVQQNIASFGGNPSSVTICGPGVGSTSVTYHIASPMSKGLFHRAVTSSGAAAASRPLPSDQKYLAVKQAELLGCPTDNYKDMFECFYKKPLQKFVDSFSLLREFSEYPQQVWTLVVEQTQRDDNDCDDNVRPFLTNQVEKMIRDGNANFVPFYTGVGTDEFGYLAIQPEEAAQCGDNSLYDEFNNNWEEVAPKCFGYESGTPRSLHISEELKSFYFNDEPLKAGSWRQLANLYADALAIFHAHRFERLMTKHSPEPVWYFLNNHDNCDTSVTWSNGTPFGIVHYDQVPLLFNVAGRPEHCEKDLKAANKIWELVVNFATTSTPIPEDKAKDFSVTWPSSTLDQPRYLEVSKEFKIVDGSVFQERMHKWDELFPMEPIDPVECDD